MCEIYREKKIESLNEQLYLAWHIVALDRSKRLPNLKKILVTKDIEKSQKDSDQEMLNKVKKLNEMFGGKVIQ